MYTSVPFMNYILVWAGTEGCTVGHCDTLHCIQTEYSVGGQQLRRTCVFMHNCTFSQCDACQTQFYLIWTWLFLNVLLFYDLKYNKRLICTNTADWISLACSRRVLLLPIFTLLFLCFFCSGVSAQFSPWGV